MRIVGTLDRSEIEINPLEAWRRARILDRLLPMPVPRRRHGVTRGTHEAMLQQDDARMLEAARLINRV